MGWNVGKWVQLDTGLEFKYKLKTEPIDASKLLFYFDVNTFRTWVYTKPDGIDKWWIMRYQWRNQTKFDSPTQIPASEVIRWVKNNWVWLRDSLSQSDKTQAQWLQENWSG